MSDSGEYYRITCRFCDTHLTVVQDQAGTEIKCPDCFSMLTVGPPPTGNKSKSAGRGGRSWKGDEKSAELGLAESKQGDAAGGDSGDELTLSETFERPAVSPLFGLESSEEDLLAPKKRKPPADDSETPATERTERSSKSNKRPNASPNSRSKKNGSSSGIDLTANSSSEANQDADLDVDLPLPVDEVLSLDAIGKLDPDSEPEAGASKAASERARVATRKPPVKKQKQKKSRAESSPPDEVVSGRPKFKYANLFMATVSMLTDTKVLAASGIAMLVMMFGGISSEIIFPVGSDTGALTITDSMSKYFISFLFGNLPYYFGLLGLWTVAGIVFQHAAQGHAKVQALGEVWAD